MYIKEIKIQGFKSFADKITIELDPTFTGIVGPNGSGKSNIVDAIKWVLGEMSIKSLRASNSMSDVIFNGSTSRGASNFASVSILFDNSDKTLNIDFGEVSIKRVVYKSGENEYFINNEKCRLKDITNLFLDSKSSKESFNIIPQNKIDQILSEKPEERRVIFEDAAGVLKYKKRKEESLSKLSKTHDNIDRINLIINENKENLTPLEESARKAREYKSALSELESVEIALIAKDITTYSTEVELKSEKKLKLEEDLSKLNSSNSSSNVEVEKMKVELLKLDEKIKSCSDEIFALNETLIELSNKKILMSERNKYDKTSEDVKNNLINLKDKQGVLSNNISALKLDIDSLLVEENNLKNKYDKLNNEYNNYTKEIESINYDINLKKKKLFELNNKIDILNENINNMSKIPFSVRSVIECPTLRGIHNILGNLITTSEEYYLMLDISLSSSFNNIVVDDEECAKEAIDYLKRRNSGRATFFPLNVIKPRSIEPDLLKTISSINGFISIASDLVSYNDKYYNIVMNQLGNIIVCKDMNSAISISKKINHRYRVVTLDGDIIHVGGVMSGGSSKSNSYISDKYEIEKLKINLIELDKLIKEEELKYNNVINDYEVIKDNIYKVNLEIASNKEILNSKNISLQSLIKESDIVDSEIKSLSSKSLDKELNNVINEYYTHEEKKLNLEKSLEIYNKEKLDLNHSLSIIEESIKKQNYEYTSLTNEINSLEISITKLNMSLDNLLNRLSEDYSLGYEKAKKEYILEIDEDVARERVSTLRKKIKSLGEVNLGSIDEYERISKRVNFLNKQKEDLEKSRDDLLNIINDMDSVMEDKFKDTFDRINEEFSRVFKSLFKGGSAHLELTEPNNILQTGIDIIAVPPGKNQKPLSLLSGGERTMTAISLLFSIMNLERVPFVILDEVESALDENNAITFGEYLKNYKDKTQLLIITHKKKTMEYLDKLYGVTMQESGVSKIVSVKLEN